MTIGNMFPENGAVKKSPIQKAKLKKARLLCGRMEMMSQQTTKRN
jgi:hypothetical protein